MARNFQASWKGKRTLASAQRSLLFVYGTLKRGKHANRYLGGARFVGVGRTGPEWTLLSNGYFPALTHAPEGMKPDFCGVMGEVFEIAPQSLWAILDDYEGVSDGLYRREEISLAQFEKDSAFPEPNDIAIQKPIRVQTYVFTGSRIGFSWHGSCW